MRRLLIHEARVHATPGRELRDMGDGLLLFDPNEPEPFWNRLEGLRWPSEPDAFDRRLAEALVLFTTLSRQPHIWPSPSFNQPADLVPRLEAHGFRDMGMGCVMVLTDRDRPLAGAPRRYGPEVSLEQLNESGGPPPAATIDHITAILCGAFDIEEAIRAGARRRRRRRPVGSPPRCRRPRTVRRVMWSIVAAVSDAFSGLGCRPPFGRPPAADPDRSGPSRSPVPMSPELQARRRGRPAGATTPASDLRLPRVVNRTSASANRRSKASASLGQRGPREQVPRRAQARSIFFRRPSPISHSSRPGVAWTRASWISRRRMGASSTPWRSPGSSWSVPCGRYWRETGAAAGT